MDGIHGKIPMSLKSWINFRQQNLASPPDIHGVYKFLKVNIVRRLKPDIPNSICSESTSSVLYHFFVPRLHKIKINGNFPTI